MGRILFYLDGYSDIKKENRCIMYFGKQNKSNLYSKWFIMRERCISAMKSLLYYLLDILSRRKKRLGSYIFSLTSSSTLQMGNEARPDI